jgi:hypothetical protein
MLLGPKAVRVGPVSGWGESASTRIELVVEPRVALGSEPPPAPAEPLPTPKLAPPRPNELRLPTSVVLGYADASAALAKRLAGASFDLAGETLTLGEPTVSGAGSRVAVALPVATAGVRGRVTLAGRPVLEADSETIAVQDLELDLAIPDPVAAATLALFRNVILRRVGEEARWPVGERIASARDRLGKSLNRDLGAGLRLELSIEELRPSALRTSEEGIVVDLIARGSARIDAP